MKYSTTGRSSDKTIPSTIKAALSGFKTMGERIRALRLIRGLSQGGLGAKIGVSSGQISNWERGKSKPSPEEILRLARALEVDVEPMVEGNVLEDILARFKTIGERIKALRLIRGLSQRGLGEEIGAFGAAISNWERGKNEPYPEEILPLAMALKVDPALIVLGKNLEDGIRELTTIGERIRALRLIKGLSQRELGEEIGVSRAAISNWERGKNKPSPEEILRLARALEVDVEPMVEGNVLEDILARFKTMGERIRALRVIRGLSEEELREKTNATKTRISKLLRGESEPYPEEILPLAMALEVDPALIVLGKNLEDGIRELTTIGERIRALRLIKGLSQRGLGEEIGVSRATISGWEEGKKKPSAQNILDSARALKVGAALILLGRSLELALAELTIEERIIALEDVNGPSQRKLAEAIGVTQQEVSSWKKRMPVAGPLTIYDPSRRPILSPGQRGDLVNQLGSHLRVARTLPEKIKNYRHISAKSQGAWFQSYEILPGVSEGQDVMLLRPNKPALIVKIRTIDGKRIYTEEIDNSEIGPSGQFITETDELQFLLHRIVDKLETTNYETTGFRILDQLFGLSGLSVSRDPKPEIRFNNPELAKDQEIAVRLAMNNTEVLFIEGGGKTVITEILHQAVRRGLKVLFVSPRHPDLDWVVHGIMDTLPVLRIGNNPKQFAYGTEKVWPGNKREGLQLEVINEFNAKKENLSPAGTGHIIAATRIAIQRDWFFRPRPELLHSGVDLVIMDGASSETLTRAVVPLQYLRDGGKAIFIGDTKRIPLTRITAEEETRLEEAGVSKQDMRRYNTSAFNIFLKLGFGDRAVVSSLEPKRVAEAIPESESAEFSISKALSKIRQRGDLNPLEKLFELVSKISGIAAASNIIPCLNHLCENPGLLVDSKELARKAEVPFDQLSDAERDFVMILLEDLGMFSDEEVFLLKAVDPDIRSSL